MIEHNSTRTYLRGLPTPPPLYDQANDPAAVIADSRSAFSFAAQAIRDNDLRTSDELLHSMEHAFDRMAALAARLVECIVPPVAS